MLAGPLPARQPTFKSCVLDQEQPRPLPHYESPPPSSCRTLTLSLGCMARETAERACYDFTLEPTMPPTFVICQLLYQARCWGSEC